MAGKSILSFLHIQYSSVFFVLSNTISRTFTTFQAIRFKMVNKYEERLGTERMLPFPLLPQPFVVCYYSFGNFRRF